MESTRFQDVSDDGRPPRHGVLIVPAHCAAKMVTTTKLSSVKENCSGHLEMARFMVARLSTHFKEVE